MKKYLILGLIAIIIVAGFLTIFWFYPGLFPFGENLNEGGKNSNLSPNLNVNQVANENTNKAVVNLNISQPKGSFEVNKAVTYKEVEFMVLTADKLAEFEKQKAGAGKTLVVLYLRKITGQNLTDLFSWLKNEVKLKNNKNETYDLKMASFAGTSSPDYAASYLLFETAKNDLGFSLDFGSGDSLKSIDLGF